MGTDAQIVRPYTGYTSDPSDSSDSSDSSDDLESPTSSLSLLRGTLTLFDSSDHTPPRNFLIAHEQTKIPHRGTK